MPRIILQVLNHFQHMFWLMLAMMSGYQMQEETHIHGNMLKKIQTIHTADFGNFHGK